MSFAMRTSSAAGSAFATAPLTRDSTSASTVFADPANSCSGQSDVALLTDLVASLKAHARQARINKKQVQNLVKRLVAIADTLGKLPDNRPTPQLLAVYQSADLLIKCMTLSPVWQHTLREHFLCQDRFTAIRERLRMVWQLHATDHWERQDKRAALEDEQPNAALLLTGGDDSGGEGGGRSWHRLTTDDLRDPISSAFLRNPPMRREDARVNSISSTPSRQSLALAPLRTSTTPARAGEPEIRFGNRSELSSPLQVHTRAQRSSDTHGGTAHASAAMDDENNEEDLLPQPSDVVIPNAALAALATPLAKVNRDGKKPSSFTEDGAAATSPTPATEEDVIAFYQRRHLGSWKLRYEDLDRFTDAAGVPASTTITTPTPSPARVARRFAIRKGFLFDGHPVVIKELVDTADDDVLTPFTITSFVQDAVARARWCHPHLARYHGAYTEKFITPATEAALREAAAADGRPLFSLLPTPKGAAAQASSAPLAGSLDLSVRAFKDAAVTDAERVAAVDEYHRRNTQASFAVAAEQLPPVMALGFIMEDLTFSSERLALLSGRASGESDCDTEPYEASSEDEGRHDSEARDGPPSQAAGGSAMSREEKEAGHPLRPARCTPGPSRGGSSRTPSVTHGRYIFSTTAGSPSDEPPVFEPLSDLLFAVDEEGEPDVNARLSLLDGIDIVQQLGQAVQYILLDQPNVPAEVVTAWLSIAPSNIFIASAPPIPMLRSRQVSEQVLPPPLPPAFLSHPAGTLNPFSGGGAPSDGGAAAVHLREDSGNAFAHDASQDPSVVFTPHGGGGGGGGETSAFASISPRTSTVSSSGVGARASSGQGRGSAELPSGTFPSFPLPYPLITEAEPSSQRRTSFPREKDRAAAAHANGRQPPPLPPPPPKRRLTSVSAAVPVPARDGLYARYAPPAYMEEGPCSRWRPHPRAMSPACYALAQLYLATVTAQPPYRRLSTQRELREKVFGLEQSNEPAAAARTDGLPNVKASYGQGYAIPQALPLPLRVLLLLAMSFTPLTADDYRVERYRTTSTSSTGSQGTEGTGSDGGSAYHPSWDYADGSKGAEEDCARVLARLQSSSCNVAINSSATFADSNVSGRPGAYTAQVPRVLTLQMFLEGLAVVAEVLEQRGVNHRVRLDLSQDPVYAKYVKVSRNERAGPGVRRQSPHAPGAPSRHVDPNSTEIEVAVDAVAAHQRIAPLDDYGDI